MTPAEDSRVRGPAKKKTLAGFLYTRLARGKMLSWIPVSFMGHRRNRKRKRSRPNLPAVSAPAAIKETSPAHAEQVAPPATDEPTPQVAQEPTSQVAQEPVPADEPPAPAAAAAADAPQPI